MLKIFLIIITISSLTATHPKIKIQHTPKYKVAFSVCWGKAPRQSQELLTGPPTKANQ